MKTRAQNPGTRMNTGIGERGRNRTFNLLIKSQLLCQLSYAPFAYWKALRKDSKRLASQENLNQFNTENTYHEGTETRRKSEAAQLSPARAAVAHGNKSVLSSRPYARERDS